MRRYNALSIYNDIGTQKYIKKVNKSVGLKAVEIGYNRNEIEMRYNRN